MLINIDVKWYRITKIRKLIIEIKYRRIKLKVTINHRWYKLGTWKGTWRIKIINCSKLVINLRKCIN